MSEIDQILRRVETDFDFYLAVRWEPVRALSGYDLTDAERAAFAHRGGALRGLINRLDSPPGGPVPTTEPVTHPTTEPPPHEGPITLPPPPPPPITLPPPPPPSGGPITLPPPPPPSGGPITLPPPPPPPPEVNPHDSSRWGWESEINEVGTVTSTV